MFVSGSQGRGADTQKVEKEKENAKTKEESEGKKDDEPTRGSPSTSSAANPQVEFSLQSGPNSPR